MPRPGGSDHQEGGHCLSVMRWSFLGLDVDGRRGRRSRVVRPTSAGREPVRAPGRRPSPRAARQRRGRRGRRPRLGEQGGHVAERDDRARRRSPGGSIKRLARAVDGGRDNRHAARHRLGDHEGDGLVARGQHQDVGRPEPGAHVVGARPRSGSTVPHSRGAACRDSSVVSPGPTRTSVGRGQGRLLPCAHEQVLALLPGEPADAAQELVAGQVALGAQPSRSLGVVGWKWPGRPRRRAVARAARPRDSEPRSISSWQLATSRSVRRAADAPPPRPDAGGRCPAKSWSDQAWGW